MGCGLAGAAQGPRLQRSRSRRGWRRAAISTPSTQPFTRLVTRSSDGGSPRRGALPGRRGCRAQPHDRRLVVAAARGRAGVIHVASPHRPRPSRGLKWHRRRGEVERVIERRLPVTPIPRTLLDLAGVVDFKLLRRALAEAHHRKLLDLAAVRRECGHGRRGSNALRRAVAIHLPELAQAENDFEAEFLFAGRGRRAADPRGRTPTSRASRSMRYGATPSSSSSSTGTRPTPTRSPTRRIAAASSILRRAAYGSSATRGDR